MMDSLQAYQAWAPEESLWSPWVKPVLFAKQVPAHFEPLAVPTLRWPPAADKHTMLILDLPESEAVSEGLAAAKLGYRPIPLYNGVNGGYDALNIVPVQRIIAALFGCADIVKNLQIPYDAPPAFLLDANRMLGSIYAPGKFDNRWCVFPQDMPSAAFIQQQGIKQVVVRGKQLNEDLSHILYRYQEQGIKIFLSPDGGTMLQETTVHKPNRFKGMFYRFQVMLGLKRNTAGGFGGQIPEPSSGGRYYGHG